jgi:hypothetical protein
MAKSRTVATLPSPLIPGSGILHKFVQDSGSENDPESGALGSTFSSCHQPPDRGWLGGCPEHGSARRLATSADPDLAGPDRHS